MARAFDAPVSPLRIRAVELRNRIVLLPHVTFYAESGRPSRRHRFYYEERARGGAGLIVTESQPVHPAGSHGKCVAAWDAGAMRGWRETVAAVHDAGAVYTREPARLAGVHAVVVGNKRPHAELAVELGARGVDFVAPRHVAIAIYEAELAARAL